MRELCVPSLLTIRSTGRSPAARARAGYLGRWAPPQHGGSCGRRIAPTVAEGRGGYRPWRARQTCCRDARGPRPVHRDARHRRCRAVGQCDVARRQPLVVDLDFTWRDQPCRALHHFDTQILIALYRIVRGNLSDDAPDARHDLDEIERDRRRTQSQSFGACLGHEMRAAQQCLGQHAAGVETVPAYRATLDPVMARMRPLVVLRVRVLGHEAGF